MKNFTEFRRELVRAQNAHDDAKAALAETLRARDEHAAFDAPATARRVSDLQAQLSEANSEYQRQTTVARRAQNQVEKLEGKIGSMANPRNWFSAEQGELRASRRRAAGAQSRHTKAAARARQDHRDTLEAIGILQAELEAHARLSQADLDEACRSAQAKVDALGATVSDLESRYDAFTGSMSPVIETHRGKQNEISDLRARIAQAEDMDRELGVLPAGSTKKVAIQDDCERRFGHRSPRAVIASARKDLARLERGEAKLERRLDSEARRAHRTIRRIVIDGNNLCYYNMLEKPFIGLIALKALLTQISDRYEVLVVFDASIRKHLRSDDRGIRKQLPRYVRTHVTASKQDADSLILRLVRDDPTAFIVTNDTLVDFPDQEAATNRRMSFELMDDRILVLDLDVEAPYGRVLKDEDDGS